VAKRLSGSGCRSGCEWGRSRDGCIKEWRSSKFFGVNVGCPILSNGDFGAKLCESDAIFPNYFEEDLLCL